MDINQLTPYLICGGDSKRLGDIDKRTLEVKGETLINRSLRILEEATGKKAVVVGDNLEDLVSSDYIQINDAKPGCGPFGGLVAALLHCRTAYLLALAVDMPNLDSSDLKNLINNHSDEFDVITLGVNGQPETLATIYSISMAKSAEERLNSGDYAIYKCLEEFKVKMIEPSSGKEALKNINNPENLEGLG